MSTTRIYVVTEKDQTRRLVEATSASQAIRHCVMNEYSAHAAAPKEIAQYMGAGLSVESAASDSVTKGTEAHTKGE